MPADLIAVVIPTIPGREALLERTVRGYRENTARPVEIVAVRGRPTIGQAWDDGATTALTTAARYLHLSADDVIPHPGWDDAAITAAERGHFPSPRIFNPDGTLHSCGSMGGGMLMPDCADGTPCGTSPFPFMRLADWAHIGPCLHIGYYADDYLSWRSRLAGLEPVVCRGFALTHLEGTVGRQRTVARSAADRDAYLTRIAVDSPEAPIDYSHVKEARGEAILVDATPPGAEWCEYREVGKRYWIDGKPATKDDMKAYAAWRRSHKTADSPEDDQ